MRLSGLVPGHIRCPFGVPLAGKLSQCLESYFFVLSPNQKGENEMPWSQAEIDTYIRIYKKLQESFKKFVTKAAENPVGGDALAFTAAMAPTLSYLRQMLIDAKPGVNLEE
jgi:hypothetical protein